MKVTRELTEQESSRLHDTISSEFYCAVGDHAGYGFSGIHPDNKEECEEIIKLAVGAIKKIVESSKSYDDRIWSENILNN